MTITYEAMRALHWLADYPDTRRLPEELFDEEQSYSAFLELLGAGYLEDDRTFDGSYSFFLTDAGAVAGRVTRAQYRAEFAQRTVLQWVASRNSTEGLTEHASAMDFTGPLVNDEIVSATEELHDAGLLKGHKAANGGYFYIEITPRGRAALRNPHPLTGSPADSRPHVTTTYSADNHGTIGNQVVGGSGHSVTSNVTNGLEIDAVLDALRLILDELRDDQNQEHTQDAEQDLDGLIRNGPRRGWDWLKNELQNVVVQLAAVGRQELADRASDILQQVGS
ncbi:hypothetical protein O4220_13060 [Rhodococcus ruber]|uniref:Uncharacterized protein n=1 Tax=Rhodococcus ruber TaxID=1830 RepID=A0ABT4MEQ5_9NOCA|nr:hypothetical protein [Rhodococcus ruber]MCZ4519447.1 hypothetical protein [Rhodococcus ruber]